METSSENTLYDKRTVYYSALKVLYNRKKIMSPYNYRGIEIDINFLRAN